MSNNIGRSKKRLFVDAKGRGIAFSVDAFTKEYKNYGNVLENNGIREMY